MATPGWPDRVEEDVVNFWVQLAPPLKDSVTTNWITPAPLAPGASV
jgi:hypothetical protein